MSMRSRQLVQQLHEVAALVQEAEDAGPTVRAVVKLRDAAKVLNHATTLMRQHVTLFTMNVPSEPKASSREWFELQPDREVVRYWRRLGAPSACALIYAKLGIVNLTAMSKLNQEQLAKTKHVGEHSVRVALALLEKEGLSFTGGDPTPLDVKNYPEEDDDGGRASASMPK
jgi:hypothetical protein